MYILTFKMGSPRYSCYVAAAAWSGISLKIKGSGGGVTDVYTDLQNGISKIQLLFGCCGVVRDQFGVYMGRRGVTNVYILTFRIASPRYNCCVAAAGWSGINLDTKGGK